MELTLGTNVQDRYEILSLIDEGGMGEVYAAYDLRLGRKVALKLLKKTEDGEKIKRFQQEARIVSRSNHPNIVSLFDFGRFDDFYFIVSELIQGETLRKYMARRKLSLKEILEIGIQIGTALSALHSLGVIHRDVKPENVMVLPDGFVKVLDFGLAKWSGHEDNAFRKPDDPTVSIFQTREGVIAGTIFYMSPEQLRGQPVDCRTDIWSLGVVLFELITGQRPFAGENNSDIIVSIIERPLPVLSEISPGIPKAVEAILQKALSKEREGRFKTADIFVNALKTAKSKINGSGASLVGKTQSLTEIDPTDQLLSNTAPINEVTKNVNEKNGFRQRISVLWVGALAAFLCLILGAFYLYYQPAGLSKPNERDLKMRKLVVAGNVIDGVISPEGRFIAYILEDGGKQSLWLRQSDELSGKELIPPSTIDYGGLSFSPDGNSIFYTTFSPNAHGTLYKIPLLGGKPREIARNVDSPVAFSPKGNEFAFIRMKSSEGLAQIVIADGEGSERVLSEKKRPDFYSITSREALDWSPDGKTIVCPVGRKDQDGEFMSLAAIDVETGKEAPAAKNKWYRVGKTIWAENLQSFLLTASGSNSEPFQVFKVSKSDGVASKVTNDLSDYSNISATRDLKRLLGVAFEKTSTIFISSAQNIEQARQITAGGSDGIGGLRWMNPGKIVFVSTESGHREIWSMDQGGQNRQRLTFDESSNDHPSVSPDGRHIVFVSTRAGSTQVWRMNSDGTNLLQLTDQMDASFPQITPDGKWVIYSARSEGRWVLWKVSIEGGAPTQLTFEQTHWPSVSPDGRTIACLGQENTPEAPIKLVLISSEDGKVIKRFDLTGTVAAPNIVPVLRWIPAGDGVTYISIENGVSNLYLQPTNGAPARKITNFSSDNLFSFDWSSDGKFITFARGLVRNNLVLLENF